MEIDYPPSRQVSSMHLVHVKGILFFCSDFISCKISSRILSSSFLILISSLLKERFTWCLPRIWGLLGQGIGDLDSGLTIYLMSFKSKYYRLLLHNAPFKAQNHNQ